MQLKNQTLERHRYLSAYNETFLRHASINTAYQARKEFRDIQLEGGFIPMQPWPTFIGCQFEMELKHAATRVLKLIKSIPNRVFENDMERMASYYGISPQRARFLFKGADTVLLDHLLGRADFIHSAEGLKCLEYNISANIGGWQAPIWETRYLANRHIKEFVTQNNLAPKNPNAVTLSLEHMIRYAMRRFSHSLDTVNVAVVVPDYQESMSGSAQENYLNQAFKYILQKTFPGLEGQLIFANVYKLEQKNSELWCKGLRIHALLECHQGLLPDEVMVAVERKNVAICNGPISWIMENKLNLALLSDPANQSNYSPDERQWINRYIPWSRRTVNGKTDYRGDEVDLRSLVVSEKERFVLKAAQEFGGMEVYLGHTTPAQEWRERVAAAFTDGCWIVQEFVPSVPYLYQAGEQGADEFNVVWGLFMFGETYGGGVNRILPCSHKKGIINAPNGAEVSVIFVLDQ
jgi:hypothetical protein